ncbi:MAG: Ig-like domain-containing protein [Candidatus Eremiobacteraeota bacterium]|nr:Ig-like domain-containing protein [Candidatus Eremiobacteraeota bacterium]
MALKTTQSSAGFRDLKIAPIISDIAGGSTTLDTRIDVPLVQDGELTYTYTIVEIKGDDKTARIARKIDKVEGSFKVGAEDFVVTGVLQGATVGAITGSNGNQTQSMTITSDSKPKYFEFWMQVMSAEEDNGDLQRRLHKCVITNEKESFSQDGAREMEYTFMAIPRDSDNYIETRTRNETAVAIPAGAIDTTPPTVSSTVPISGATAVSVSAAILINFSEPMLMSSLNVDNIFASNRTTGAVLGTTMTIVNSQQVSLLPTPNFAASTPARGTVTRGVKDAAGNGLATAYQWDWTCA